MERSAGDSVTEWEVGGTKGARCERRQKPLTMQHVNTAVLCSVCSCFPCCMLTRHMRSPCGTQGLLLRADRCLLAMLLCFVAFFSSSSYSEKIAGTRWDRFAESSFNFQDQLMLNGTIRISPCKQRLQAAFWEHAHLSHEHTACSAWDNWLALTTFADNTQVVKLRSQRTLLALGWEETLNWNRLQNFTVKWFLLTLWALLHSLQLFQEQQQIPLLKISCK